MRSLLLMAIYGRPEYVNLTRWLNIIVRMGILRVAQYFSSIGAINKILNHVMRDSLFHLYSIFVVFKHLVYDILRERRRQQ